MLQESYCAACGRSFPGQCDDSYRVAPIPFWQNSMTLEQFYKSVYSREYYYNGTLVRKGKQAVRCACCGVEHRHGSTFCSLGDLRDRYYCGDCFNCCCRCDYGVVRN